MPNEPDKGPLNIDDFIRRDKEQSKKDLEACQPIPFTKYLELVQENPKIAQNAPSRVLEMIEKIGVEAVPEKDRWFSTGTDKRYRLFKNRLFGLDGPIQEFINHLKTGAMDLPPGKKLLMLIGPPASGKSSFADILIQSLEDYRGTPLYRIKDCPMNEEPLHLLPTHLREEFKQKTGIKIKGKLCPPCQDMLEKKHTDKDGTAKWWEVPTEPIFFSARKGIGIGSFEAGGKLQSVEVLVGSPNMAILSTKGPRHPFAYDLSGELEKGNRALFEGRELLKVSENNPEMLWVFISVAEEQRIKVQGSTFPDLDIDTVLITHTNLHEYKKWNSNPANEALHSRFRKIRFPYSLRIKDEVMIYKKLIEKESKFSRMQKYHIAPGSLELAALFAILTRLVDSNKGIDKLTKAKAYNGDKVLTEILKKNRDKFDLRELTEEGQKTPEGKDLPVDKQEGMFGISPRDVMDALSNGLVKHTEGNGCLTPLRTINALREGLAALNGYLPEQLVYYEELLSAGEGGSVMTEYRDLVIKAVSRAFLRAYSDLAEQLFNEYIKNIELDCILHSRINPGEVLNIQRDELTGKVIEPDQNLMKAIEAAMGYSDDSAKTIRGEVLQWKAIKIGQGEKFNLTTYSPLARAVEQYLLRQTKDTLKLVLAPNKAKDETERKRVEDIFDGLTDKSRPLEERFCDTCAKEVVRKASEFLK